MAHFDARTTAPFGAITTYRIVQFVDAILLDLRAMLQARQTNAALRQLTDRELEDIGLCRPGQERAARQTSRII